MQKLIKPLCFDEYIAPLYKKAGKKLSFLAKLSNFICTNKRRVSLKAFIDSQFGYCPLIRIFSMSTTKLTIYISKDIRELSSLTSLT